MSGSKFSRLTVPLIQGGMGVGISLGGLAGAVAREGAMGVISTASIGFTEEDFYKNPAEASERALRREIRKARKISEGKGMVAVNAMSVTTDYARLVRAAADEGIDAVISGAGLPTELPELLTGSDALAIPIVSSAKAAKVITGLWKRHHGYTPDAIVVEGPKAGGHLGFDREELLAGTCPPLTETVAEVSRLFPEIPVFGAGGVRSPEDVKAVMDAGACGVQVATPFILTEECDASEGFKRAIAEAGEDDIFILKSPVGMPGRGLKTPLTEAVAAGRRFPPSKCVRCIRTCNPAETPYCITEALKNAYLGNRETGLFFSGESGAYINEIKTVKQVVESLFGKDGI
jgi:nitronate monooxygenase